MLQGRVRAIPREEETTLSKEQKVFGASEVPKVALVWIEFYI